MLDKVLKFKGSQKIEINDFITQGFKVKLYIPKYEPLFNIIYLNFQFLFIVDTSDMEMKRNKILMTYYMLLVDLIFLLM